MHSLIICGTPWCDLHVVGQYLHASGMAAPKPAPGRVVETLADWHQSLFEQQHATMPRKAVTPGKAWELAASELFLANWQQPVWGWADARNVWLLNFWHDFDAHIRFILVHTPATQALAHAVAQAGDGPFSARAVLDRWCAYQTELLAFYLRHRERCIWIQAAQIDTPASWLPTMNQQWGLTLEAGRAQAHATAQTDASDPELTQLLASLARQAVAQHGQAQVVQDEVLATLPPLPPLPHSPQPDAAPASSSTGFDALQASDLLHALSGQLGQDLRQQIAQLQQQNQDALQRNAQLAAELDQTQARRDAETHAKTEIQTELAQLQAHYKDVTQESELLLLQLHRMQEELEAVFLKSQEQQKQLDETRHARDTEAALAHERLTALEATNATQHELTNQLASFEQQAQTATQSIASLQAEKSALIATRDAETRAKAEIQTRHKDATQENKLLLLQLHQVQEELEAVFLKSQDQQKQLDETRHARDTEAALARERLAALETAHVAQNKLTNQLASFEQQAQAATQSIASLQAEKSALLAARNAEARAKAEMQTQFSQLQARHQDATQENELLLLQLHQVQEELEHYFLQHQQTQKDLQHTRERLAKWAQRYPNHCEWDALHVPVATDAQLQLQLRGVQHGSRMLDVLEIQLDATQNTLQLNRTSSGNAPLLRWPHSLADAQPLTLALVFGTPQHPATIQNSPALNQLTPSDLQLLQAICLNVAQALPDGLPHRDHWVAQCQQWAQAFHSLPACWRFDSIGLHHEQVNPDYEHLWFNLGNVHYGARHWPRFEFRLSASNVRKKSFTHLPKLEFPLPPDNATKQFENWFEESEDDKGPKFELRFDTKTPAMDVSCWRALNAMDQAQCLSLLQHLPYMLDLLQASGAGIHRPWTDWQQQAIGIQRALVTCLNLPSDPFAPAVNTHA